MPGKHVYVPSCVVYVYVHFLSRCPETNEICLGCNALTIAPREPRVPRSFKREGHLSLRTVARNRQQKERSDEIYGPALSPLTRARKKISWNKNHRVRQTRQDLLSPPVVLSLICSFLRKRTDRAAHSIYNFTV